MSLFMHVKFCMCFSTLRKKFIKDNSPESLSIFLLRNFASKSLTLTEIPWKLQLQNNAVMHYCSHAVHQG